jgi:hypothetical protein
MSRYSTSATNRGSTHVAFGFLTGLVSFDFGQMTVFSCLHIWLETVRDQPVPTLPKQLRAFLLAEIERCDPRGVFDKTNHRECTFLYTLDLEPAFAAIITDTRESLL